MKKLLVAGAIAAIAVGGWKWHGHAAATDGGKLVTDRIWIDHMPRNERDTFNAFLVITEQPMGVFQATSRWQGQFEMFQYDLRGNEIRATFPQTGSKETITAKARKCSKSDERPARSIAEGDAQVDEAKFDFCLELDGGKHGVKRYYSMEGWEIGSAAAAQEKIRQIENQ